MSTQNKPRIQSVDCLRGFDMFWIMGAEDFFHSWNKHYPNKVNEGFVAQLTHTTWHGFTLYDLIFPLFLFVAGVAAPFSINLSSSKKELTLKVLKRAFILILLGIVYNLKGLQYKPIDEIRFASVLGHIGIAWAAASIIFIYVQDFKKLGIISFSVLVLYWLLLGFTSATGYELGDLSRDGNFVSQFDRWFLPGQLHGITHDPEGILSKIPATASALFGIMAGLLLKNKVDSPIQKLKKILTAGFTLIALALVWNFVLPINKNIWTSSFACLTAGLSFLLVGIFFYIIDMKGFQGKTFTFFKVIGANSILIYMSDAFIDWHYTASKLLHWTSGFVSENTTEILIMLGVITIKWIFLKFFYDRNIFLKV